MYRSCFHMKCGMNESNESPGPVLNCHRASKGKQTSYNIHLTEKYPPKQTNIYRYTAKRSRAEK